MKITTVSIFLIAVFCQAATIQEQYSSIAAMPQLLLTGLDLPLPTCPANDLQWAAPTNIQFQGGEWIVLEKGRQVFDNCIVTLISLSCGETNVEARINVCDTPATAAFSLVLPYVGFSSMSPLATLDKYGVSTNHFGMVFINHLVPDALSGNPVADVSHSDIVYRNISVSVSGSDISSPLSLAILRAGGVAIPDGTQPEP